VAGANIGDGPGFEVVLFCSVLAAFYLLVLWFLIAWASGLGMSLGAMRAPEMDPHAHCLPDHETAN
jgi:hypothetical protein